MLQLFDLSYKCTGKITFIDDEGEVDFSKEDTSYTCPECEADYHKSCLLEGICIKCGNIVFNKL
jgi:DNA-directed RNA polymerase subunit RPC12/RpoP